MIIIPIIFMVQEVSYGIKLLACPWDYNSVINIVQTILNEVFSIISVVLADSLINGVLYLLSFGWCITTFALDKNKVTHAMIVFGSLYITLLAQSYS